MLFLVLQTALLLFLAYILGACFGSLLYRFFYRGEQSSAAAGSAVAFSEQPFIELENGPPPAAPNLAYANRFERALLGTRRRERRNPRLDLVPDVSQSTSQESEPVSDFELEDPTVSSLLVEVAEAPEASEIEGSAGSIEDTRVAGTYDASSVVGVIEACDHPVEPDEPLETSEADRSAGTMKTSPVIVGYETSGVVGVIEAHAHPAEADEPLKASEVESSAGTMKTTPVIVGYETSSVVEVIEAYEPAKADDPLEEASEVEWSAGTVEIDPVAQAYEVSNVVGVIEDYEPTEADEPPASVLFPESADDAGDVFEIANTESSETTDTTATRAMMKQPSSVEPALGEQMPTSNDYASLAPSLPVASNTGGITGASAPLVVSAQQMADDLTRIYAIDPATAAQLIELGVSSYARLAAFTRADVDRIGATIDRARIWREGWIEQAQLLANGRETAYARKIAGNPDTLVPFPENHTEAAPSSFNGEAPRQEHSSPGQDETVPVHPDDAAADAGTAAPDTHPEPAAPVISAVAEAVAAGPETAPEIDAPVIADGDDLTRIRGITAEAAAILRAKGVTTFRQIADMRTSQIRELEILLGMPGQSRRYKWQKQARKLMKRAPASTPSEGEEVREPEVAADPDGTSLDGVEVTVERPAGAPEETGARPHEDGSSEGRTKDHPAIAALDAGSGDDLKRIRGIGTLIEKKLNALGISRYGQIANWDAAEIARISQVLDFKDRIEREAWVEQARILVSGGRTEFSDRVDHS